MEQDHHSMVPVVEHCTAQEVVSSSSLMSASPGRHCLPPAFQPVELSNNIQHCNIQHLPTHHQQIVRQRIQITF